MIGNQTRIKNVLLELGRWRYQHFVCQPKHFLLLDNQFVQMDRSDGYALHADVDYRNVGVTANYVAALCKLNKDVEDSCINAFDITGRVAFNTFTCPSRITFSYQCSDDADVYRRVVFPGPFPPPIPGFIYPIGLSPALPAWRVSASYGVQIMTRVQMYFEWVHDQDFCIKDKGTDRSSDYGVLRLSSQY